MLKIFLDLHVIDALLFYKGTLFFLFYIILPQQYIFKKQMTIDLTPKPMITNSEMGINACKI